MTTEKRFVGIGDKNSSKVTFSLLVASAEALVVGLWYIYMYNCMYNGMYNCIFAMHHHNRHQPFEIFTRPSSSVTPVTQDHFYSINATQDNAPPRKLRDAIPCQVLLDQWPRKTMQCHFIDKAPHLFASINNFSRCSTKTLSKILSLFQVVAPPGGKSSIGFDETEEDRKPLMPKNSSCAAKVKSL